VGRGVAVSHSGRGLGVIDEDLAFEVGEVILSPSVLMRTCWKPRRPSTMQWTLST
jgi:hypothetical protein